MKSTQSYYIPNDPLSDLTGNRFWNFLWARVAKFTWPKLRLEIIGILNQLVAKHIIWL